MLPLKLTWRALGLAGYVTLCPSLASAALTSAESAQIHDLYRAALSDNADRLRSLVARPDLSVDEAERALAEALRPVPFDDVHERFLEQMYRGAGSEASRSDLFPAVVAGLLGRAANLLSDDRAEEQDAELLRIHAFLYREAGTTRPKKNQTPLVREESRKRALTHYAAHLALPTFAPQDLNGRTLTARAQAELAVAKLARGTWTTVEVAKKLGWSDARARLYATTGMLAFADGREAPAWVNEMLTAVVPSTGCQEALWIGKSRVTGVTADLGFLVALTGTAEPSLARKEVGFALARCRARTILDVHPSLAIAAKAIIASDHTSTPVPVAHLDDNPPSAHHRIELAAAALWADAPRALESALSSAPSDQGRAFATLTLGIGLIAFESEIRSSETIHVLSPASANRFVPLSGIQGPPAHITGFTFEGKTYALTRDTGGNLNGLRVNGKTVALSPPSSTPAKAANNAPAAGTPKH